MGKGLEGGIQKSSQEKIQGPKARQKSLSRVCLNPVREPPGHQHRTKPQWQPLSDGCSGASERLLAGANPRSEGRNTQ